MHVKISVTLKLLRDNVHEVTKIKPLKLNACDIDEKYYRWPIEERELLCNYVCCENPIDI